MYREDIGDSRLYELLKTLVNYGFVVKTGRGEYSLPADLPSRLGIRHAARMWLKRMP